MMKERKVINYNIIYLKDSRQPVTSTSNIYILGENNKKKDEKNLT